MGLDFSRTGRELFDGYIAGQYSAHPICKVRYDENLLVVDLSVSFRFVQLRHEQGWSTVLLR